jgi:hypothetical protein
MGGRNGRVDKHLSTSRNVPQPQFFRRKHARAIPPAPQLLKSRIFGLAAQHQNAVLPRRSDKIMPMFPGRWRNVVRFRCAAALDAQRLATLHQLQHPGCKPHTAPHLMHTARLDTPNACRVYAFLPLMLLSGMNKVGDRTGATVHPLFWFWVGEWGRHFVRTSDAMSRPCIARVGRRFRDGGTGFGGRAPVKRGVWFGSLPQASRSQDQLDPRTKT